MPTDPYEIDPTTYKYGERGDQIKALQQALVDAGYELAVDGIFGNDTREAVQRFETDHGYHRSLSMTVDLRTLMVLLDQSGSDSTPVSEDPSSVVLPTGKGMFIRSLTGAGTVDEVAQTIRERGLKWICVQRIWQYDDSVRWYNGNSWEEYSSAWLDNGCELWIWGWPVPSRIEEFVDAMIDTAAKWGAVGIVVDAEEPWLGQRSAATDLAQRLMASGLPIALTSYGAPWNFSTFPFEEFSCFGFGIPQIYDAHDDLPDDYPSDSVAAWQQRGFEHVVPASNANKSPSGMSDLLSRTPTPDGAILWWDWYNANSSAGRWDVIGSYQIQTASPSHA